jgi:imidazolonepropionase-like amidohydrolase
MNFKISNAIVRTTIGCLFICLFSQTLMAQPIPGKAQSEPIAIIGGTIHTATGTVIENGVLIFEDGVISVVADSRRNREWEKDRYKQIFATGKHIYPGLIAMNSQLGLVEIKSLRPSQGQ